MWIGKLFFRRLTVCGTVSRQARRYINCHSCGIELQNVNPKSIGYYKRHEELKGGKSTKGDNDSIEYVKYLLFSQDIQNMKESAVADNPFPSPENKPVEKPPTCKRCYEAIHQNKYTLEDFKDTSLDVIKKDIPKGSNIMHLISLPEFPMHINKKLLEDRDYNVSLIYTKADQIVANRHILTKYVIPFLSSFLKNQMSLPLRSYPTTAVSAVKMWNMNSMYDILRAKNYLVGSTNVGKSTIINCLIKNYMGQKLILTNRGELKPFDVKLDPKSNMKSYMKAQEAGVSYIPNMTRTIQPYQIVEKVVFDLPGYTDDARQGKPIHLENIIRKDWLQRIRKTELFKSSKIKKKTYVSFRGTETKACYTLGGIFHLVAPANTINQIINYIPGQCFTFKNIDRAIEVFNQCNDPGTGGDHPLNKYCGVTGNVCNKESYVRHILPPFQGSVEVVIKNVGFFSLRTTGKYQFRGLYELWVPKGMEVCIREPLEKIVMLTAENESTTKFDPCPKSRPIVSSSYPMPFAVSDTLNEMRNMFISRTSNDISRQRHINDNHLEIVSHLHEEPPNLYWYYQW
ncbi:Gep3p KNAG_0A03270 [Huiozyma naganishii CBS 8797]|uniref:Genetic interactor of prohibitins 3, mitochondrial n=1 Tax=Huiozyma naganishii (strain ATCC MYA-139 / BCRC 22969 / CBS 8797 / KCTC 17520 / NBRC 10181 / NCYC 3082 / Yp74L-3) TaxID=1071383 RepID=J7S283_HUIN7|nr:hypothetical protein KNAG_0A03270 [Kazachstania naganishii CBS 8797]CCK68014.1 hypothetical protein KNAG_0A03270 [Kazachstania naganishii CBS 8797]